MLKRRTLLNNAVKGLACMAFAPPLQALAQRRPSLKLRSSGILPLRLPLDFTGLGYEMSSVATPGLLSDRNERYVRLVSALGSEGIIRAGGIVADYTRYADSGISKAEPKDTVITRKVIEQFDGFLVAVGWKAIWSLNFAQGTVDEAVIEARAVASVLGPRLIAFEIGNEVENYARGDNPFRTAPYTYERYRSEYDDWRSKILQIIPGARFAAPDTATSVEWVERMARDANGDVQLLTTHYYRGGQKEGTADQLLRPDPRLRNITERLQTASVSSGIPWRMCETNSFFGGGRPGVSNAFVGTLWTLDFMLYLAASGCAGVNMETGVNQLGFISSYSPIGEEEKGRPWAGAPYYGMLAFATAVRGCNEITPLLVPGSADSVSAYLLGTHGRSRSAVLINRTEDDLSASFEEVTLIQVEAMRLIAPSGGSVSGITFAGAQVEEDGSWAAKHVERIDGRHVAVPRMSAVVLLNKGLA